MLPSIVALSTFLNSRALIHERQTASATYEQVNIISQLDDDGNLVRRDPRVALYQLDPKIGMDEEVKSRIRTNSGYIQCLTNDPQHPISVGSGALYGNGSQLVTARHVLYDDLGRLSKFCFFQNQLGRGHRVPLDLSERSVLSFTDDSKAHFDRDLVAVRLKGTIFGAHPFTLNTAVEPLMVGDRVVLISAHQKDQPNEIPMTEPGAQICHVKNVYPRDGLIPPSIYTDCTSDAGASGAITYLFKNGDWLISSVTIGSGDNSKNYEPYSLKNGSSNMAIGIDRVLSETLNAFARNDATAPEVRATSQDTMNPMDQARTVFQGADDDLEASVGIVRCERELPGDAVQGVGLIVADREHVLIADPPLNSHSRSADCSFESALHPGRKVKLMASAAPSSSLDPYVVAELAAPIEGSRPMPLASGGQRIAGKAYIVSVKAEQFTPWTVAATSCDSPLQLGSKGSLEAACKGLPDLPGGALILFRQKEKLALAGSVQVLNAGQNAAQRLAMDIEALSFDHVGR